jgi:hypothetical protein
MPSNMAVDDKMKKSFIQSVSRLLASKYFVLAKLHSVGQPCQNYGSTFAVGRGMNDILALAEEEL